MLAQGVQSGNKNSQSSQGKRLSFSGSMCYSNETGSYLCLAIFV